MAGPLDGVQAKLERAQHHLKALHAYWQDAFHADPVVPVLEHDAQAGDYVVRVRYIPDMPPYLGGILGDILHNLRSGLNHLAFELVRASGGLTVATEPDIQFPIFDIPPTNFATQVRDLLPSVAADPIAIIERHQPYNRPDLSRLRRLSNQDKHRVPVLLRSSAMFILPEFRVVTGGRLLEVIPINVYAPLDIGAELVRLRIANVHGSQLHVEMKGHFIPEITFEDGAEAIHVLMSLGGQCRTIARELEFFVEPPARPLRPPRRSWPGFSTLP